MRDELLLSAKNAIWGSLPKSVLISFPSYTDSTASPGKGFIDRDNSRIFSKFCLEVVFVRYFPAWIPNSPLQQRYGDGTET